MPDTMTVSHLLLFDTLFIDGDTRTLTVKNPKSNISLNEIEAFNSFLQTSNILIGDRAASQFNKIKTVVRRGTATTKLDLSEV